MNGVSECGTTNVPVIANRVVKKEGSNHQTKKINRIKKTRISNGITILFAITVQNLVILKKTAHSIRKRANSKRA